MSPHALSGRWILLGALALGAAGCAGLPPPVRLEPPKVGDPGRMADDPAEERAYRQTLARYSDHDEVYQQLDTSAFVAATMQAWPFREARAKRLGQFRRLPDAGVADLVAAERTEAEAAHEVFFGAHVNNPRHDDFDKKDSLWRIALITPNGEFAPEKVERVGRATPALRALYPYLGDFWVAYELRFPKRTATGVEVIPANAEKVLLRVAGPVGEATLELPAR